MRKINDQPRCSKVVRCLYNIDSKSTGRTIFTIVFFIFLLFFLAACSNQKSLNTLDFSPTPVISSQNRYALIVKPYIAIRDTPGDSGITVAHSRCGDIFYINGTRIVEDDDSNSKVWLNIDDGWVSQDAVQLYSNKEKAAIAGKQLGNQSPE